MWIGHEISSKHHHATMCAFPYPTTSMLAYSWKSLLYRWNTGRRCMHSFHGSHFVPYCAGPPYSRKLWCTPWCAACDIMVRVVVLLSHVLATSAPLVGLKRVTHSRETSAVCLLSSLKFAFNSPAFTPVCEQKCARVISMCGQGHMRRNARPNRLHDAACTRCMPRSILQRAALRAGRQTTWTSNDVMLYNALKAHT